jgi:hypothetical protein
VHLGRRVVTSGSVVGGRYKLEKKLRGAPESELWWAADQRLGRPVMLRLASDGADLSSVVKASARLGHPNVVRVLDAGREETASFVVTEPALGLDLAEVVRRSGPLRPVEAAIIGAQAADALAAAARVGVRMAPIDPWSIWLSPEGVTKLPVPLGVEARGRSHRRAHETVPEPGPDDVRALVAAVSGVDGRLVARHRSPEKSSVPAWLDDYAKPVQSSPAQSKPAQGGATPQADAVSPETDRVAALEALRDELLDHAGLAGRRVPEALARLALVVDGSAHLAVPDESRRRRERTATRARDQIGSRRHRRGPLFGVGVVVVLLAAGLAATSAGTSASHAASASSKPTDGPSKATGQVPAAVEAASGSLPLQGAEAFDPPPGNGHENQALLPAVTEADPSEPWHTDIYANRRFGNLTSGVGVILELAEPARLSSVSFVTTTLGWRGEVFVAGALQPTTLVGWGAPVALIPTVRQGKVSVSLPRVDARRVLIWFDHLGPAREVSVEDAQVFGRPTAG